MKRCSQIFRACLGLVIIHLALQTGQSLYASGVTFTNNPTAISNTYTGNLTLQIGGLNTGETVVIQKFLDLNTNGVIDAADLLVQQFQLTDGQGPPIISTITNINVPGDLNSTNGAVTAKLSLNTEGSEQEIVGQYLIKLSSPTNHFTPITNAFTVTNFLYAQSFTGNVVSNGTATLVPFSLIYLLDPGKNFRSIAGTVANSAGSFTIKTAPGTYKLISIHGTNFVTDVNHAPVITLGSGGTITTNLSLLTATQTISGKLVDVTNTSLGLPGVLLAAVSTNGIWGFGSTDTNGGFTLPVNSGQYSIGEEQQGFDFLGYVSFNNQTNVAAGATNVVIGFPKATALIYGSVKDGSNNPLVGLRMYGQNGNNGNGLYQGDATTDQNGNYAMGVVASNWGVGVDQQSSGLLFANYIFSQGPAWVYNNGGSGTNISAGAAVPANFTALIATNHITGYVRNSGNNPIVNAGMYASATINSVNYNQGNAITDTNGNYSINVANGNWSVDVDCNGGNNSLDGILGAGNYQCPNNQNVNIVNNNGVANFTVQPAAVSTYQIVGYVTDDSNTPIVGVTVHANGSSSLSTNTDSQGYYMFTVTTGTWDISVDCSGLSSQGYSCVTDQMANISNSSTELDFYASICQSLAVSTTTLPNLDAGFFKNFPLYNVGCNPPYSWSMTPGSLALPSGLSLASDGTISGTPSNSTVGTNYFSVRVTDAQTNTADQFFPLVIYPTPRITNFVMPTGILGVAYNVQLGATGGSGSFFGWNLVSGSLPPGLVIDSGGDITGTPTQTGTFLFTAYTVNNEGSQPQKSLSITIGSPQITSSLTNGITGVAYLSQLQVVGGTPPYTWSIANGSQPLPSALSLSTNGLISGTPATNGIFSFIVRETDSNAVSVTKSLSLTVNAPAKPTLSAPVWITNRLQLRLTGVTGQNYTIQYSTNLASTNWTQLFITNNAATNSFIVTDPNATNSRGFYRVLVGP